LKEERVPKWLDLPAQTLPFDRAKPLIHLPAELAPAQAALDRTFKQSSASITADRVSFGKRGARTSAIRDGGPTIPFKLIVCLAWLLVAGVFWGGEGKAQSGALNKSPTELLKKYLTLDLHGARLEPLSYEAIKPYVAWKEEPAWGQVVVVSGYEVPEDIKRWQVINNLDVIIPVAFRVLGTVDLSNATFAEEPHVQEVRFHVKAVGGLWRIVEPILPPHVGQKRMVNYVRQALSEEREPSQAEKLTTLREVLKKSR
jgi:hypothetical protein